jgi:hypothetical protein
MKSIAQRSSPTPAGLKKGFASKPAKILAFAIASLGAQNGAMALDLDLGNPDLKLSWDNTIKYNTAFRVEGQSKKLTSNPNLDDGDRNFDKGLISNRLDLLSQMDLSYKKDYGVRVSGAAWYDDVYNQGNDNDSPETSNNYSKRHDQFVTKTRDLHGRDAEFLDYFAYGRWSPFDMATTVRFGSHALIYGESLFFGNNGIAGGQSPVDVVKLLSVPNSQFQEIVRPVNQISTQIQLRDNLAVGAYYQFKWDETRIPGSGSYFSTADVFEGGERLLFGPVDPATRIGPALFRGKDITAKDSGQFGGQVRWRPEGSDLEFGFYATRYHDKTPQVYLSPGENLDPTIGKVGEYRLVYPEDIKAYGMSVSTQIGEASVAAEFSVRRDTPLVSDPQTVAPGSNADNDKHPAYAVGNSAHAQVSSVYILNPSRFWSSATALGEIAWNRRTSITKNPDALAANSSRDAWAMRAVFEPAWYQVAPGLDLSAPVGIGFSTHGNSSVVNSFNPGGKNGGDLNFGIAGLYQQTYKFGANYTHFFGDKGNALNDANELSFDQSLADRDFISMYVQRSF